MRHLRRVVEHECRRLGAHVVVDVARVDAQVGVRSAVSCAKRRHADGVRCVAKDRAPSRAAITGGEWSRGCAAPLTEKRSACVCVEAVFQLS